MAPLFKITQVLSIELEVGQVSETPVSVLFLRVHLLFLMFGPSPVHDPGDPVGGEFSEVFYTRNSGLVGEMKTTPTTVVLKISVRLYNKIAHC